MQAVHVDEEMRVVRQRSLWWRIAILSLAAMALVQLVYLIHENRRELYQKVCRFDLWNNHEITPVNHTSGKLEFPRLYEIPACGPKKNSSTSKDMCSNLGAIMRESDRQAFLRLLQYFDKVATEYNWTYFMAFGTLWGSWRHHDVIPWDHDVDIMVEYNERIDMVDKIEAFQERFVPKQCSHHKVRLHDREYITGTTYLQDVGRWYDPSIDMFFFTRNTTHIMRSDYPEQYVHKLEDIFPLHRRPLSTLQLFAPRDPLKFLMQYYSEDSMDTCGKYSFPKCEDYKEFLPFVHRKWKNNQMEESLILNGKVLQVKAVAEIRESIPFNPYTLASMRFPNKIRLSKFSHPEDKTDSKPAPKASLAPKQHS
ncbi:uncharacterized protein LOC135488438 [Lineus longissimus]|uniref:uncharacterized protein LOC135488438 n=1 Tax=Lineus longissimus TaxID=88925 RepID=UPI002B4F8A0E